MLIWLPAPARRKTPLGHGKIDLADLRAKASLDLLPKGNILIDVGDDPGTHALTPLLDVLEPGLDLGDDTWVRKAAEVLS